MPYRPNKMMQEAARVAIEYNESVPPSRRWGTRTGKIRAQQIAKGDLLSPDVIVRMLSFLKRHQRTYEVQRASKNYGKGYYSYLGWGGPSAIAWAEDKIAKMQRAGEI